MDWTNHKAKMVLNKVLRILTTRLKCSISHCQHVEREKSQIVALTHFQNVCEKNIEIWTGCQVLQN